MEQKAISFIGLRFILFCFIYSLFNVDNTVKKHCLQTI